MLTKCLVLVGQLFPRPIRRTGWKAFQTICAWGRVPIQWYWCFSQGMRWQKSWRLIGRPLFRMRCADSRIVIGSGFTANSVSDNNSIGVFQPVILSAWGEKALLEIGNDVGMSGCSVLAARHVKIGNRVMIGAGALILDTDAHPLDPVDRMNNGRPKSAPVIIEDDVFVGTRAIVMKGVTLGKGAVVGAGAVVTSDVPSLAIAVGNPAKVVGIISQKEERRDF